MAITRWIRGLVSILALSTTVSLASAYSCKSFFVEVPIENATQLVPPFSVPFPDDGYAAVSFYDMGLERDPPPSPAPQFQNFTGTFNISVEYCTPDSPGPRASTVQFLTHGLGFDRSYWDFRLPSALNDTQYSYVNTAVQAGYSTLAWDRLGCGLSESPDPYLEVQALIELAILAKLTSLLRDGSLSTYGVPIPQKVFHVGHSFGSTLSTALAASPEGNDLTDGVVLTSFSLIFNFTAFVPFLDLAKTNQPARFANRSSGDLTWPDKFMLQYGFFAYPQFDPQVLAYADATKWPITVGEELTQRFLKFDASAFKGPVLFVPAQHDLIFCKYNCVGLFGPGSPARQAFGGNNSDVEVQIHPSVGHAINVHYNATGAYDVIQDWAMRHGF